MHHDGALATAAALGVAFAAKWQLWRCSPRIELDGSRRWVTIGNVAPAFVSATTHAHAPRAPVGASDARGPVDR